MFFFVSLSSNKALRDAFSFLDFDRSCEFVFNLRLSHERAGFSPKIGSTESS